jgi:hypothetical protein
VPKFRARGWGAGPHRKRRGRGGAGVQARDRERAGRGPGRVCLLGKAHPSFTLWGSLEPGSLDGQAVRSMEHQRLRSMNLLMAARTSATSAGLYHGTNGGGPLFFMTHPRSRDRQCPRLRDGPGARNAWAALSSITNWPRGVFPTSSSRVRLLESHGNRLRHRITGCFLDWCVCTANVRCGGDGLPCKYAPP